MYVLDDNECTLRTHDCDQLCSNTDGSYTCSCNNGFTLDEDGKTCHGQYSVSMCKPIIFLSIRQLFILFDLVKNAWESYNYICYMHLDDGNIFV